MSYTTDHTDPGCLVWAILPKGTGVHSAIAAQGRYWMTEKDAANELERIEDVIDKNIRQFYEVRPMILTHAVETDAKHPFSPQQTKAAI